MRPRDVIEDAIRTAMHRRGWRHERIGASPGIYAANGEITPYYWPLLAVDEFGKYSISGTIGVIDRRFEADWAGETLERYPFPLCLLSVNIGELIGGFVHPHYAVPDVDIYLESLAQVLTRLPRDRAALHAAFAAGEMLGIEIESWGLMSQGGKVVPTRKYLAFRSYVLRQDQGRSG